GRTDSPARPWPGLMRGWWGVWVISSRRVPRRVGRVPGEEAQRSWAGASPQAPWGACCGARHNTRILSRPESEACLDEIRSGGACPPDKRDGPSPHAPCAAWCGVRHTARILSSPESEACLDEVRWGGAGPPDKGDGASPQAPWGACCGARHNTRILSRPESEACLDEIRSGGACPPYKRMAVWF